MNQYQIRLLAAAVANPSLNNIMDGDAFIVTLNFSPAGATESSFISGTMVLSQSGLVTQFALDFQIPATLLSGTAFVLVGQFPNSTGVVSAGNNACYATNLPVLKAGLCEQRQ